MSSSTYVSASVRLRPSRCAASLQALDGIVSLCETTAESVPLDKVCESVFGLLDSHAAQQPELEAALLQTLLTLLQPSPEQHDEAAQKHSRLAQYILEKYSIIVIVIIIMIISRESCYLDIWCHCWTFLEATR